MSTPTQENQEGTGCTLLVLAALFLIGAELAKGVDAALAFLAAQLLR